MTLDIPLEAPCDAVDISAVEALLGEEPVATTEWVPGDKPFDGLDLVATNFGCLYEGQAGPDGVERELLIAIDGEEMTVEAWQELYDTIEGCRTLESPLAIQSDAIGALVCPSLIDGWSRVTLSGVFGTAGTTCHLLVPDDEIDATLEARVVATCARTFIELGS